MNTTDPITPEDSNTNEADPVYRGLGHCIWMALAAILLAGTTCLGFALYANADSKMKSEMLERRRAAQSATELQESLDQNLNALTAGWDMLRNSGQYDVRFIDMSEHVGSGTETPCTTHIDVESGIVRWGTHDSDNSDRSMVPTNDPLGIISPQQNILPLPQGATCYELLVVKAKPVSASSER